MRQVFFSSASTSRAGSKFAFAIQTPQELHDLAQAMLESHLKNLIFARDRAVAR
jgi:hypothetical protein